MTRSGTNWFKPKHHGYGAVPSTWQGWVATSAFTVAMVGLSGAFFLMLGPGTQAIGTLVWVVALLAAVYMFTSFARKRTDGAWGYRWKGHLLRDMREDGASDKTAVTASDPTTTPNSEDIVWPATHRR